MNQLSWSKISLLVKKIALGNSAQRDMPSRLLVQGIERLAEQLLAQIRKRAHELPPLALPDARPFSRRRANTVISLAACLSPFFSATSMPLRYAASASSVRPLSASARP